MARRNDDGHKETDDMLESLESRIEREYRQASKEVQEKLEKYMQQFSEDDKKHKALVDSGKLNESDYKAWRLTQIMKGNRWTEMRDTLAQDYANVNKITSKLMGEHLKDVYALNHNYGTYEIEHGAKMNTSYSLYDHSTVERLLRDNPKLIPDPGKKTAQKIAEGKLKKWNKKQIQSVMTQSILQGESIPDIAERLSQTVGEMDANAAIRTARTMTTEAECAGRIDSYKRAEEMGIELEQVWIATLDNRTRHEHALLDGQKRKVGEPFEVEGTEIMYPGDPDAEPYMVYNCRCTLIAAVEGTKIAEGLDGIERDSKLGDMSYEEWKKGKEKREEEEIIEQSAGIEQLRDVAQNSTDKFDFWLSLDENQQAIFKASGMSLDDVFDTLHSGVEVSEWKAPNPGGPESFAIQHDFSNNNVQFNRVPAKSQGWMADANAAGVINIRDDGLGDDWRFIIGHEAGHQLADFSPEIQQTILLNPGNVLGRYNTRLMAFDGVYGEYNPEEAFATCVSNYVRHPKSMQEKYPEAYRAIDELFTASPSALDFVKRIMMEYEEAFK